MELLREVANKCREAIVYPYALPEDRKRRTLIQDFLS